MTRALHSVSYAISPVDAGITVANIAYIMWHERLGGLLVVGGTGSTYPGDLNLVSPSGALVRIGQRGSQNFSGIGWSYDDKLWLRHSVPSGISQVDAPQLQVNAENLVAGVHTSTSQKHFAMQSDRILYFDGNRVVNYSLVTGAQTIECAILSSSAGPGGQIMPFNVSGGHNLWWLITPSTGAIYLYNATTRLEVSGYRTAFNGAVTLAAYSRKHNLFIALSGTTLYYYFNEPAAATIAAPSFSPSPSAGKKSTLSTTVLGSNGEPCVGRIVTFAVTAGTVTEANVPTNASGVASTTYLAPFDTIAAQTATVTLTE